MGEVGSLWLLENGGCHFSIKIRYEHVSHAEHWALHLTWVISLKSHGDSSGGRPLPPRNTQCIETTGRTNPTHPPIPSLPFQRPGSCYSGRSQPRLCRGQGPFTAIGRLLPKRERCRITLAYSELSSSCFFHSVDASGSPVGCPVV